MRSAKNDTAPGESPWIDATVPLRDGMVHWPGDPSVAIERVADMERGDSLTLSKLTLSAHTGTHMDAPLHFVRGGKSIDELPMDIAIGPARVIGCGETESIGPDELRSHRIRRGERVLFKTKNSTRDWPGGEFLEDYVSISLEGARFLARRGVRLVGVDYLSVGGFERDGAETHIALLQAGIWIVEGLDLSRVSPGLYRMVCLPLRIEGGEGAPARVLLRPRAMGWRGGRGKK
jgi:arylformamidase